MKKTAACFMAIVVFLLMACTARAGGNRKIVKYTILPKPTAVLCSDRDTYEVLFFSGGMAVQMIAYGRVSISGNITKFLDQNRNLYTVIGPVIIRGICGELRYNTSQLTTMQSQTKLLNDMVKGKR
jgi:hypothetical protein